MNNFLSNPATTSPAMPQLTGPTQIDGTATNMGVKPTKAPLQTRSASPDRNNTSGMERAMAAEADRLHPPKHRR